MNVHLVSLATAVPPHEIRQEDIELAAEAVFAGRAETFRRMRPIYGNAGIAKRHSCVPLEWYGQQHGWPERHDLYVENALDLLQCAAEDCLVRAGCAPEKVDGIVVVSSTGMTAPSLDARLLERMPFRRNVQRLPVFGLGCAGGVLGLARTAALARANPGQKWLLLVVELCGLTFRPRDLSNSNIVATAIFGDGAAAVLLSTEGNGPRLTASGEHTWPETLDVMGWHIEDDGFGVLFSRDIPSLVRHNYRDAVDGFLGSIGWRLDRIRGFAFHPGGTKVIDALEEALDLSPTTLDPARQVLSEFGNMSAATVLFVLERVLAAKQPMPMLVGALGPGFTAGFAILEQA